MSRFLIILFFISFCTGCTPSRLSPREYIAWVEETENGLKQEKAIADYEFTLQYRPADLIIYQAMLNDSSLVADSLVKETSGTLFFTFRYKSDKSKTAITGMGNNPELMGYLISGIENDFTIISDNDTIYPASCHYERDYGLSPCQTINLVFETGQTNPDDFTFVYDDKVLQTGPIRFNYSASILTDIPKIQF